MLRPKEVLRLPKAIAIHENAPGTGEAADVRKGL
jgi:hypothetical protein